MNNVTISWKDLAELDEAAERAGGYVSISAEDVRLNYRELLAYCRNKGIQPIDLTIREYNTFIVN